MRKIIKNSFFLLSFFLLSFLLLYDPKTALFYALTGLNTWFERLIPTLFPFMVLTGIIVQLQLTEGFARIFKPFLFPLFRLPDRCLYPITIGFLCGFPMGAKTTGDMYRLGQLTRKEADYLLAFCNNIGPVFFTGVVLPFLPAELPVGIYLFGMYGIPLCYGILLRYFCYKDAFPCQKHLLQKAAYTQKPPSFAAALDASVSSGIQSITKLGGYMIFFNLLNLLPQLVFARLPASFHALQIFSGLFLEITGGIVMAGTNYPILLLSMLQFGGISCFAQTYSMISDTDISLCPYLFHKCMQALMAFLYYRMLFSLLF